MSVEIVLSPLTIDDIMVKLEAGPWSFARYGDTELACMTGANIGNVDGQPLSAQAASDLWATLAKPGSYTYGLQKLALREQTVPQRIKEAVDWVDADALHKASEHGQLGPFSKWLRSKRVGLVGPARLRQRDFIRSGGYVEVPIPDAYSAKGRVVAEARRLARDVDVILFAASMLAKVAIHALYPEFGNRVSLIDCGSLWEPYCGHRTRRYHKLLTPEIIDRNLGIPLVTVITPTGDRPVALDLCARWMARQTYSGPVQWLIVDDGREPFAPTFSRSRWAVEHVRRDAADPSARSLAANVLAGIEQAKGDLIIIVEDDDWYSPGHLADLVRRLESADVVGNGLQRYYHVPSRQALQLTNKGCCLCQLGFRRELIPLMATACKRSIADDDRGVDARFWQEVRHRPELAQDVYMDGEATCVGIKGLPGRPGLGIGHRPTERGYNWQADPELDQLRAWVGDDVAAYLPFSLEPAKEAATS